MNTEKLTESKLRFSEMLTEKRAYYSDDKITVRTFKTHPQTKIKLRLADNWKKSPILKAVENGMYYNHWSDKFLTATEYKLLDYREYSDWQPCHNYSLNHQALKWIDRNADTKSILNDIRLNISTNQIDIELTDILNAKVPESRLKLIVEVIKALVGAKIIKGDWSQESEKTRPYAVLKKYFHVAEYEIRIDSGRYGKAFYKKCKSSSPWTKDLKKANRKAGETFNQVPLVSNAKQSQRTRGYHLVVYDRSQKPENTKADKALFPFRLEVKLLKKLLENSINDLVKGNAEKIIKRLKDDVESIIQKGVTKMKALKEFDIFVNKTPIGKPLKQITSELIEKGSFIARIEHLESEVTNINEILAFHGLTLPKQRGLKII